MEDNAEATQLRELAQQFDAGVDVDSQANTDSTQEDVKPVESDASASDSSKDQEQDSGKDEASSLKRAEESKDSDSGKQEKASEKKSEASKFAKELERKQRTWEKINAEREAVKAEQEALRREREQWMQERTKSVSTDIDTFRDPKGLTAKDYEDVAKSFEADGDYDKAKLAREKANQVRQVAQEHFQKVGAEKFKEQWAKNFDTLAQSEPWLKDDNHPLNQRAVKLLQDYDFLQGTPDGLKHAVAIVKLEESANRSKELETENKSLKEQLEKLNRKTAIGKSVPAKQLKSEDKSFDKMSLNEQREYLRNKAAEFDREN